MVELVSTEGAGRGVLDRRWFRCRSGFAMMVVAVVREAARGGDGSRFSRISDYGCVVVPAVEFFLLLCFSTHTKNNNTNLYKIVLFDLSCVNSLNVRKRY